MTTCPTHGFHNGRTGCPTCRRIKDARSIVAHGRGRGPAHRRALEYLDLLGERASDRPLRHDVVASFEIGGR